MPNDFDFDFDDEQDEREFSSSATHTESIPTLENNSGEYNSENPGFHSFPLSRWFWGGGSLVLLVIMVWIGPKVFDLFRSPEQQSDVLVTLRGNNVSSITIQTPVLIGRNTVGVVEAVDHNGGRVNLRIFSTYAKDVRTNSAFSVKTDGWFPDDPMVISITPGDNKHPTLRSGSTIHISDSLLPSTIPWRFVLLCIAAFVAVTIALKLWLKVLAKIIFGLILLIAILIAVVAVIVCYNPGLISLEQLPTWLYLLTDLFPNAPK